MRENVNLQVVYCRLQEMHELWVSSQEKHEKEMSEIKDSIAALLHLMSPSTTHEQGRQETPAWQSPPLNDLDECKVATNEPVVLMESSHQDARQLLEEMPQSQKCVAKELCVDYNGEDSFEMASWIKVDLEPQKYVEGSETSTNDEDGLISEELKFGDALKQHLTARQVFVEMPRLFFSCEIKLSDQMTRLVDKSVVVELGFESAYVKESDVNNVICFDPGGRLLPLVDNSLRLELGGCLLVMNAIGLLVASGAFSQAYLPGIDLCHGWSFKRKLGNALFKLIDENDDDCLIICYRANRKALEVTHAGVICVGMLNFDPRRQLRRKLIMPFLQGFHYAGLSLLKFDVFKENLCLLIGANNESLIFDPGGDLLGFLHEKKSVDFGSSFDYRLNSTEHVDWIAYILLIHSNVEAILNTSFAPSTVATPLGNFKVTQGWYADVAAGTTSFKDFGRKQRIVIFFFWVAHSGLT